MRTSAYCYTNRGGRSRNEDSVRRQAGEDGVFVLADGLGGHGGGEISYMDIYHHDDRPSLLRVLGRCPCRPEIVQTKTAPGDAYLLCSDGFWEYVYQEEILSDLLKSETPKAWTELMLLRHIRQTPAGNDNFSLITVFVEEDV